MPDRALAIVLNSVPKGCHGHDTDHRDQAYKHSVFNQSRALAIVAEPIDYATDGRDPLLSASNTES